MKENLRECKRCLLYEMADKSAYESIKSYIDAIPDDIKCDKDIYAARLAVCRECDNLLSGMCRKCGCYVEIRAIKRDGTCPNVPPLWK